MDMGNRFPRVNDAAVVDGGEARRRHRERVASALLEVGVATCARVVYVVAASGSGWPAEGGPAVYVGALLEASFFGGVAAICAALCVAGDAPVRRSTGRVILCAALLSLVVAVGLGGGGSVDPELLSKILDAVA